MGLEGTRRSHCPCPEPLGVPPNLASDPGPTFQPQLPQWSRNLLTVAARCAAEQEPENRFSAPKSFRRMEQDTSHLEVGLL